MLTEEEAAKVLSALLAHRQFFEELGRGDSIPSLETVARHYDLCDSACTVLICAGANDHLDIVPPWRKK